MSKNIEVANLESGTYFIGKFCGVHRREKNSDDGSINVTYSLVFETSDFANKTWVTLTKDQARNGIHNMLKDDLKGHRMLCQVFYTNPNVYNGRAYQNIYLQGNQIPMVIS